MVKSLEQYLADLPFARHGSKNIDRSLTSAEKSFVEKYIGMDALEAMPLLEPSAQDIYLKPIAPKLKVAEPELRVASPRIVVAEPQKPAAPDKDQQAPKPMAPPEFARPAPREAQTPAAPLIEASRESVEIPEPQPEKLAAPAQIEIAPEIATPQPVRAPLQIEVAEPVETRQVLRDSLREQDEIQVVSFFVAGQLFLLPVAGIQEVLRRMELVRVPQAPDFIAGAINLRGKVTPLVHLSALLTNESSHEYNQDKNFIIICGTDNMQIGLIIDKINSMHVVPQNKFIWNAEAKLGDAAEFLFAIADLDDRVCGVVAPDVIIRKIAQS